MSADTTVPSTFRLGLFLSAVVLALYVIRLAGPSDLIDYGQEANTAYVLDAVRNAHWIVQRDLYGAVASKPPLYTWLASSVSVALGRIDRFTLSLPAALATLTLSLVIFAAGRAHFGWLAGFLGALAYACSGIAAKQVALVRTDGLFALTVTVLALLAFRAWQKGSGWAWFWLAAALSTLTKGPLGILLAATGLLAALWERRSGQPVPLKGSHLVGVGLFLLVAGGWFAWAYVVLGQDLIDRMLVRELYGRAISKGPGSRMFVGFYLPWSYFLARFAPWSLLAAVGFWRLWKSPAADPQTRRFERFLFCWFVVGMVIFSAAAHQRADLIFPLIPAAALVAGRELARWLNAWKPRRVFALGMTVAVLACGATFYTYSITRARSEEVRQTLSMEKLAQSLRAQVGDDFPLVHVETSPVLQFYLGTSAPCVTLEHAVKLLQGDVPVFVAIDGRARPESFWGTNAPTARLLAEGVKGRRNHARILSNHPRLEWTDPLMTQAGAVQIRLAGVRGFEAQGNEYWLKRGTDQASAEFTNRSTKPQLVRVRLAGGGVERLAERLLPPGEKWKIDAER